MTSTGHHLAPTWFGTSPARRFYQAMFGRPVNTIDETSVLVDPDGSLAGLLSP